MFSQVSCGGLAILAAGLYVQSPAQVRPGETDPLIRFEQIARKIKDQVADEKVDSEAVEAMEIVLGKAGKDIGSGRIRKADDLNALAKTFQKKLAPLAKDAPTLLGYTSLELLGDMSTTRVVVGVTFGAASRVAAFDRTSGRRLPVAAKLEWIPRYRVAPHILPDGSVVLFGDHLRDLGMRGPFRVDLVPSTANGYGQPRTWIKTYTLEYGGPSLHGNRLTLTSIDEPASFSTTAPERLFPRVETYAIENGKATLIHDSKQLPHLRYLDSWMVEARHAKVQTAKQHAFAAVSPQPDVLEEWSDKRLAGGRHRVSFKFLSAEVRFDIRPAKGAWTLLDAAFMKR